MSNAKMVTAGLLVAAGALWSMLMLGVRGWAVLCLAAGLTTAVLGSSLIKRKILPAAGRSLVLYDLVLGAALAVAVLAAPAVSGRPPGPEELNSALQKSTALLAAGEVERAEQLLIDLDSRYPEVDEIQLNLSAVYLRQRRPEEAARVLETGKYYRYFNADELFNYALSYYQRENYLEALLYLKKALQQNPHLAEACLYASESARRLDDYRAAAYYTRRLVDLQPELPRAYVQLARVELMVMKYREAAEALERALQLRPDEKLRGEILKLQEEAMYYVGRL